MTAHMATVTKLLQDKVRRGWQIPLPPAAITTIPGLILAPVGLALQDTINELGEILPKQHLTHNQTFDIVRGAHRSVNRRVCPAQLTTCIYGVALLHYTHHICHLCAHHHAR